MSFKSRSVPFEIPNVNHGFVVVKGLFRFETDHVVLEFDERDGFVGMVKSDLKEKRIPFGEIESMEFVKKWFRTRIIIAGRSMKSFHDIPGAEQGRVTLKIKQKDRKLAEKVLSDARLRLSEHRLKELEEE
jgi:hypothetical protein